MRMRMQMRPLVTCHCAAIQRTRAPCLLIDFVILSNTDTGGAFCVDLGQLEVRHSVMCSTLSVQAIRSALGDQVNFLAQLWPSAIGVVVQYTHADKSDISGTGLSAMHHMHIHIQTLLTVSSLLGTHVSVRSPVLEYCCTAVPMF